MGARLKGGKRLTPFQKAVLQMMRDEQPVSTFGFKLPLADWSHNEMASLIRRKLIEFVFLGHWRITERGKELLSNSPTPPTLDSTPPQ